MAQAAHAEEEEVGPALALADLTAVDLALQHEGDAALREALKTVRPADVGVDFSRRPLGQCARVLGAMNDRDASAALQAAHPTVAAGVLQRIDPGRAGKLLMLMPTEREVDVLSALAGEARVAVEKALDPEDKANVERILRYDEGCVGRLMTPMIWRCERLLTVGEALAGLRQHEDDIEVASNCYVVSGQQLLGVVALRELVVAPPETPIEQVMTRNPIAVAETTSVQEAAEIVRRHDFLSLPVIDPDGRLVGAVRVDDLLDRALSKVGKGLLNQGGVAGKIAARLPYFQSSIVRVVRSRVTWLVLLFVAETATGTVLRHFEESLAKVVALSFFVPLLIGTGGNAGSQTVSTVIRALALGEIRRGDVWRVLFREGLVGLMLGLLVGGIGFGRAMLWGVGFELAACVAVTILVVCIWANTVGSVIPLAADKLKIDPTVISGPMITTLVDATGLFLYFTVASVMISELAAH